MMLHGKHLQKAAKEGVPPPARELFCYINRGKNRADISVLETAEWREWSDREIARRCRVNGKTVTKMREKVTAEIRSMDRTFTHHKTGKPTKARARMNIHTGGIASMDRIHSKTSRHREISP